MSVAAIASGFTNQRGAGLTFSASSCATRPGQTESGAETICSCSANFAPSSTSSNSARQSRHAIKCFDTESLPSDESSSSMKAESCFETCLLNIFILRTARKSQNIKRLFFIIILRSKQPQAAHHYSNSRRRCLNCFASALCARFNREATVPFEQLSTFAISS